MRQPDLHYDGPLTQEYLADMNDKILAAIEYVKAVNPEVLDEQDAQDLVICKLDWIAHLQYAGLRLAAIITKLECGFEEHRQDEDRKCIDIMLCILRDLEIAKAKGFVKSDLQPTKNTVE